ncbi:hypothetical protein MDAP_000800 [Mitosporidium daphniae]|uniref:Uncharacterized protein n=1 Tax=Mitosporidium daphniae TaxID=1485682 RepID=A0A098VRA0_9MICR|nr:uncharacterized protein DI09_34p160 [Mitosporidium daphniae]KGG51465.1 hypothetical protein DI09_34p160 [Mitosporidium daphniae]|eukprot:XP_013237892.1 uncharacterized protein DI09_34p160 [Mitosporidium daphniae]
MFIFFHPPPSLDDSRCSEVDPSLFTDADRLLGSFEIIRQSGTYVCCSYLHPNVLELSQYSSFLAFNDIENLSMLVHPSPPKKLQQSQTILLDTNAVEVAQKSGNCPKFISGYPVSQLLPVLNHVQKADSYTIANLLVMVLQVMPLEDATTSTTLSKNRMLIWVADPTLVYFPIYIWNVTKNTSLLHAGEIVFWTQIFIRANAGREIISGHASSASKIIQFGKLDPKAANDPIMSYFFEDKQEGKNLVKKMCTEYLLF